MSQCKVMHLGKRNIKNEYSLMGHIITTTKGEKDLGVYFCESFKPSSNWKSVSKSDNKIVRMIRRNIVNRSSEGMLILYKTLVRACP